MKLKHQRMELTFGAGSIQTGFERVELRIYQPGREGLPEAPLPGALPPNPQLARLLEDWQTYYYRTVQTNSEHARGLKGLDQEGKQGSILDGQDCCEQLPLCLNDWLESKEFRHDLEGYLG